MSDPTVTLSPDDLRYLDAEVAAGRGSDRAAVIAAALEAQRSAAAEADELDGWKALRFRELAEAAEVSVARGDGVVVGDVRAYLEGLMAEVVNPPADRAA